jgi:hypothetical protein
MATAAPWRILETTLEICRLVSTEEVNCDEVLVDSHSIAYVPTDYLTEEQHANARLICAAPDLLAALKAMLPEGWDDGSMDHMPGVREARRAIVRATEGD